MMRGGSRAVSRTFEVLKEREREREEKRARNRRSKEKGYIRNLVAILSVGASIVWEERALLRVRFAKDEEERACAFLLRLALSSSRGHPHIRHSCTTTRHYES